MNREELPPFIAESLLPGCYFFILQCSIKNVLPRSSEDGCLLFLTRVYRINGMHKLVCLND